MGVGRRMTIKEAGVVRRIEFLTEAERKEYLDWLDHTTAEYYVLSEGIIGDGSETKWYLNIVERWAIYPLFDAERWL